MYIVLGAGIDGPRSNERKLPNATRSSDCGYHLDPSLFRILKDAILLLTTSACYGHGLVERWLISGGFHSTADADPRGSRDNKCQSSNPARWI